MATSILDPRHSPVSWLTVTALLAITACSQNTLTEAGGRWQPVNQFPRVTQAVPQQTPKDFSVTPLDGTVKALLSRWADDGGLSLDYSPSMDYSLHDATKAVRGADLAEVLARLGSLYRTQGLEFSIEDRAIVVRQARAPERKGRGAVR